MEPMAQCASNVISGTTMQIKTTRFGSVKIDQTDILLFPHGLLGFENHRHWVLLQDEDHDAIGWLQNIQDADLALPVVSPRRFLDDYQVQVDPSQLATIELGEADRPFVMAVLAHNDGRLTINLRAPVIINLDRRLARQVVTSDEQPLQFELPGSPIQLRKSA